jgi:nucleoside-diphosphate-sugar epimerase
MSKNVFVAGASGAIGRRLCKLLVEDGWLVTGATRSAEKKSMLVNMGVIPVVVDVFDKAALIEAVIEAQPEIVVHQLTDLPPALDPKLMADALVRNARLREVGTGNLVAAASAAGAKRMIAQSISFIYASGVTPFSEDAPLMVEDPDYGETARAVVRLEQQVLSAPFEGIILRYGKLYGPGTGFDTAPEGGPLHVDDAADAARRALTKGEPGIYNVAEDDGSVSINKTMHSIGWTPGFRIDESS